MQLITAKLKDEYEDVRPDCTYPKWTAHVGEDEEHLKGRMRNKGCTPDRYDWNGSSTPSTKPALEVEI